MCHLKRNYDTKPSGYLPAPRKSTFDPKINKNNEKDLQKVSSVKYSLISDSKISIKKLSPKNVTIFLDTCYSGVSRDDKTLLASARPNADEIEVDACPAPMTSYLLSVLFKKPLSPLFCLMVGNSSNLPVSNLCA